MAPTVDEARALAIGGYEMVDEMAESRTQLIKGLSDQEAHIDAGRRDVVVLVGDVAEDLAL